MAKYFLQASTKLADEISSTHSLPASSLSLPKQKVAVWRFSSKMEQATK